MKIESMKKGDIKLESQWEKTKTDLKTVNWRGQIIHLKNVPAIKNKKTGRICVYPTEVAKAEIRELAKLYNLKPREVSLLLMLLAKPGPFQKGKVFYKYHLNKMLFYQWKEMQKQGLGETFPHYEFKAAPRGPVPKNLSEDLKRLQGKGLVSLSYKKWGKGPKEASLVTKLTQEGVSVSAKLAGQVPEPLQEVTVEVKKQLFMLEPIAIREKVHKEYPEYKKTYVELDRD